MLIRFQIRATRSMRTHESCVVLQDGYAMLYAASVPYVASAVPIAWLAIPPFWLEMVSAFFVLYAGCDLVGMQPSSSVCRNYTSI